MSFGHPGVALLEQQGWCCSQIPRVFRLVSATALEVQAMGAVLGESHQCSLVVTVHPLLAALSKQLNPSALVPPAHQLLSVVSVPSGASPGPSHAIISEECLQALLAYQG